MHASSPRLLRQKSYLALRRAEHEHGIPIHDVAGLGACALNLRASPSRVALRERAASRSECARRGHLHAHRTRMHLRSAHGAAAQRLRSVPRSVEGFPARRKSRCGTLCASRVARSRGTLALVHTRGRSDDVSLARASLGRHETPCVKYAACIQRGSSALCAEALYQDVISLRATPVSARHRRQLSPGQAP